MEMEYDNGRRGRFIIVLGLILAVVAGGSAFFVVNNAQRTGAGNVQTTPLVVAIRQIPARKPIEAGDVAVRDVPVDPTNLTGTFTDPTKVIGLIPGVTILADQPIYTNLLASQIRGGAFSILEPGETLAPDSPLWRAVSMTIPDERAVAGSVSPGDRVDIVVTVTVLVPQDLLDKGQLYSDKASKVIYQDIEVLSKTGSDYVVKVPLATAEELSHLQATGQAQFSLVLRPPDDTRPIDASRLGETTNLIIKRYGLPIPEVYPPGSGALATPRPTTRPSATPSPEPSPKPSAAP
jgi:Flp pilus assembly protein CpaB